MAAVRREEIMAGPKGGSSICNCDCMVALQHDNFPNSLLKASLQWRRWQLPGGNVYMGTFICFSYCTESIDSLRFSYPYPFTWSKQGCRSYRVLLLLHDHATRISWLRVRGSTTFFCLHLRDVEAMAAAIERRTVPFQNSVCPHNVSTVRLPN